MKRLLLILTFLLFASPLWATTYYVDNTCANNGDGTTTTCGGAGGNGPFNSIANAAGVAAGSTVSLKGGLTFRETLTPVSGTVGNPTIYNSYGTGKANIKGSNLITTWTNHSGNIWQADVLTDPGSKGVWFNGTVGALKANHDACTAQYDYFWGGNVLYVYSTADPSTVYTSPGVESATRVKEVDILNKSNITFDNILFAHNLSGFGAIYILVSGSTISGIIIQNCEVGPMPGYGIQLLVDSGTITGTVIQNNYIHDSWNGINYGDGGLGWAVVLNAGTVNPGITGTLIRYNNIADCYVGIGTANLTSSNYIYYNKVMRSKVNGIDIQTNPAAAIQYVYNNVVYHYPNTGVGHGIAVQNSSTGGLTAKNNIIYSDLATVGTQELMCVELSTYTNIDLDNNLYYAMPGYGGYISQMDALRKTSLADWKTQLAATSFTGKEASAISGDPSFVNLAGEDFHLTVGSPAINAGVSVGLTSDYEGNLVPKGPAPDIGAYEKNIASGGSYRGVGVKKYGGSYVKGPY